MIGNIGISAAVLAMSTTTALADDSAVIGAMQKLTDKITELSITLEELRSERIPEGAVLAFLGTENKPCPDRGWSLLEGAAGKVIVGAGGNFTVGSTGGQEERSYFYQPILSSGPGQVIVIRGVDNETEKSGWRSYTNLPPYIALYLCKKDAKQ